MDCFSLPLWKGWSSQAVSLACNIK